MVGLVDAVPSVGPAVVTLRTLLLIDLVDSTKLVEEVGDARAFEIASHHDRVARDLLPRHDGLEVDKSDGFLLLFERPHDAVCYALAYHRALAELSMELGVELRARAGIHLGEVFLRRNPPDDVARGAKPLEVEGLAKPMAARVMSLAAGRQTLITEGAFNLARHAAAGPELAGNTLSWLAHGPYVFKGVQEPVDIYEVGIPRFSPLTVPPDSAKARRAVAAGDEITLGWRPGPGLEIPRRGGWTLKKRLGEGGFGEVWLAVQEATGEKRAFKFCYEANRLRALQREVTLFRLLKGSLGDREEILRIFDWNLDEAPYYLEAEYVAGGNLAEWVEEHGGLARLTLATRLEVAAQVADALAAAHSVGVLHKDVKPQNVLVIGGPERPRVKLTDFGIGAVVDRQALLAKGITVLGLTEIDAPDGRSGTAASRLYMAPEVAEGRTATVQADIYALGVMIYQMVAGDFRRALGPGWRRDVDDELLAEDIASFVDREPQRRPASAREVAERLRALEQRRQRLVAERREREEAEAARRALERSRRRRKVLAATTAAAVLVAAMVSILAVQAMRAREVAEQRRGQAEDLISFMLGDLRNKLQPLGRLEILDDVGDKALDYFAAVPEGELSDSELLGRSRALYQIGDVRIAQGSLDAALGPLEESLALAASLVERKPYDGQRLFELAQAYFWVGFVDWRRGSLDTALERFESYLEVAERLVKVDPENLDWRLEVAYAHSNIGFVLFDRGEYEGALERYRICLAMEEEVLRKEPDNAGLLLEVASAHNAIGKVLVTIGDPRDALEHHQADLAIKEKLLARDPGNATWLQYLAASHNHVGLSLLDQGATERSLEHFETALATVTSLVERDSSHMEWQRELAIAHLHVGEALDAKGLVAEAADHFQAAVGIMETVVEADPADFRRRLDLAHSRIAVGEAAVDLGDSQEAIRQGEAALVILSEALRNNPTDRRALELLGLAHVLLGRGLDLVGDGIDARAAWDEAVASLERIAGDTRNRLVLATLARALLYLDRLGEARSVLDRMTPLSPGDKDLAELAAKKGLRMRVGS